MMKLYNFLSFLIYFNHLCETEEEGETKNFPNVFKKGIMLKSWQSYFTEYFTHDGKYDVQ